MVSAEGAGEEGGVAVAAVTGRDMAQRGGVPIVAGEEPCFDAWYRVIVLPQAVLDGTDPWSLLQAAHEAAHALQPRWRFFFVWFTPIAAALELDAWRRAVRMMSGE